MSVACPELRSVAVALAACCGLALGACSLLPDWSSYARGAAPDTTDGAVLDATDGADAPSGLCSERKAASFCTDFDDTTKPIYDGFRVPYESEDATFFGDSQVFRSPSRSLAASIQGGPLRYAFSGRPLHQDASFKVSFDMMMMSSGEFYSLLLAGIVFTPTLSEGIDQDFHGFVLSLDDAEHKTFGAMEVNSTGGIAQFTSFLSLAGGERDRWLRIEMTYLAKSSPELTFSVDGVSGPAIPVDLSSGRVPLFAIGILAAQSPEASSATVHYDNVVIEPL